jgi:methylisocitrate lyase
LADRTPASDLRALLDIGAGLINTPIVSDPISARLAQSVGFDALTVGGAMTATRAYGLPDGTISIGEVIAQAGVVRNLTDLPMLIDLDDAGGSPPLVGRHVRMAEDIGADAVIIEDTDCGSQYVWDEKARSWAHVHHLRSIGAASSLIEIALEARRDSRTVVIARTDAMLWPRLAGEDPMVAFDDALERAQAFAAAGADALFIVGLPQEQTAIVRDAVGLPLMNHVGPPMQPALSSGDYEALAEAGLRIGLYAATTQIDHYGATRDMMLELAANLPGRRTRAVSEDLPDALASAVQAWFPGKRTT